MRATLSVIILCAHALGLAHTSFAAHVFDGAGGVFEEAALVADAHEGASHACTEPRASADPERCAVFAVPRATLLPAVASAVLGARVSVPAYRWAPPRAVEPRGLATLAVAPKGSPPRG
jgi:hypothetical protein